MVVVGGGYGGATAAKYLRMWSGGSVDVTLVEPNADFISCPMSNLVLGGAQRIADVTVSYASLAKRWGVRSSATPPSRSMPTSARCASTGGRRSATTG